MHRIAHMLYIGQQKNYPKKEGVYCGKFITPDTRYGIPGTVKCYQKGKRTDPTEAGEACRAPCRPGAEVRGRHITADFGGDTKARRCAERERGYVII